MKVMIDIKDNKTAFVLELLKNFSFVKVDPISTEKAELIKYIKESVENLKLVRSGKMKARRAKDLLNEI